MALQLLYALEDIQNLGPYLEDFAEWIVSRRGSEEDLKLIGEMISTEFAISKTPGPKDELRGKIRRYQAQLLSSPPKPLGAADWSKHLASLQKMLKSSTNPYLTKAVVALLGRARAEMRSARKSFPRVLADGLNGQVSSLVLKNAISDGTTLKVVFG